jgi:hypothetical protein
MNLKECIAANITPEGYLTNPPFGNLIFHHIFFLRFLLREGDPSFLQISASSDLSKFGITGYLGDFGGRSGDSLRHYIHEYFTRESPLLPPTNQIQTCHPECQRGISFFLNALSLIFDFMKD